MEDIHAIDPRRVPDGTIVSYSSPSGVRLDVEFEERGTIRLHISPRPDSDEEPFTRGLFLADAEVVRSVRRDMMDEARWLFDLFYAGFNPYG